MYLHIRLHTCTINVWSYTVYRSVKFNLNHSKYNVALRCDCADKQFVMGHHCPHMFKGLFLPDVSHVNLAKCYKQQEKILDWFSRNWETTVLKFEGIIMYAEYMHYLISNDRSKE